MLSELTTIFRRDIDGLRAEVRLYPDDKTLWQPVPGCPNTGGTLALHAVGNLRHFIGAQLGGTGYVRDREAEFATRGLTRTEVVEFVAKAHEEVDETLIKLDPGRLAATYPLAVGGRRFETGLWLLHLTTHLAYHLGQLDYHRRTVTADATGAGVVSVHSLPHSG